MPAWGGAHACVHVRGVVGHPSVGAAHHGVVGAGHVEQGCDGGDAATRGADAVRRGGGEVQLCRGQWLGAQLVLEVLHAEVVESAGAVLLVCEEEEARQWDVGRDAGQRRARPRTAAEVC
jgi:hypothetical protein